MKMMEGKEKDQSINIKFIMTHCEGFISLFWKKEIQKESSFFEEHKRNINQRVGELNSVMLLKFDITFWMPKNKIFIHQ
jgi:hypothetical protein